MKIFKKIFTTLAALAMVAVPAAMAGTVGAVTANPDSVTVTKNVNDVTNPVINTFTYTVEEDSGNPATGLTGLPSTFTIAFDGSETITSNTATKTGSLDLSSVNFTTPGQYKFKISETGSTDATNYPLDSDYWYAYVFVDYVMDADGVTPTSTLQAVTQTQGTENDGSTKGDITFETTPDFTHIELSKSVTGNLGDINKYFKYTIALGSGMANATINATGAFSTDGSSVATSPATLTADGSGNVEIYLKHGQSAQIGITGTGVEQIPVGTSYTITEDKDGYKAYIDGSTTDEAATTKTTVATDAATFSDANTTSYVNNKEADPITGIFVNYWPFMLLIALGIAGMYIIKKTSKKNN